jgi:hypothetical protein
MVAMARKPHLGRHIRAGGHASSPLSQGRALPTLQAKGAGTGTAARRSPAKGEFPCAIFIT